MAVPLGGAALVTGAAAAEPTAGATRTTITPSARVAELIAQMTLDEKLTFVSPSVDPLDLGSAGYIPGVARLGIPELRLTDGTAGIRLDQPATALPVPAMLASTFDPDLAYDYGNAMGQEGRALQQDVLLAPMVNIIRVPQGGRNFETFSEDPLVTAQMAGSEVAGVQDAGMIATAKHYALNNQETNKTQVSAEVSDQALHEVYLPGYAAAVEAGAGAVMCAYNKVGGTYSCGNDDLLNEVLKTQLDFQGWVMSDWGVTHSATDLVAGLDQEMYWIGQQTSYFTDKLRALLDDGTIAVAELDDAVARILGQMEKVGLLDGAADDRPALDTATTEAVAQDVAEEGATLLKNADAVLPLTTSGSIALIGRTAQEAKVGGSGSAAMAPGTATSPLDAISARAGAGTTVQWDAGLPEGAGIDTSALADATGFPFDAAGVSTSADLAYSGTLTITEAGSYTFAADASAGYAVVSVDGTMVVGAMGGSGAGTVELSAGPHSITLMGGGAVGQITLAWLTPAAAAAASQAAADLAAASDVAIVFAYDETSVMTDRPNLSLPSGQDQLIAAVAAANPRTIVVLNTGSAVTMPWLDQVAAVLDMYYPGVNGAEATARLLYGDVNPSGKLAQTFPASDDQTPIAGDASLYPGVSNVETYAEGIDVGYRWYVKNDVTPLFPFGYGLSYTTFSYSAPKVVQVGDEVSVSLTLTNTGAVAGQEVAQVYAGPSPTVTADQAVRKLVGYQKVALEPGESTVVEIPVDLHQFEYWNSDTSAWELGTGARTFWIGSSSADLPLTTTASVETPTGTPEPADPPTVTLSTSPTEPASGWFRDDVQVSATVDDEGAQLQIAVDSGSPVAYTGPVTVSEEGVHTVRAVAADPAAAGDLAAQAVATGQGEVEITVRIDRTAPVVSADTGTASRLKLSATDALSGVAELRYSLDGGTTWVVYGDPVTVEGGPRDVAVTATDVAGNQAPVTTVTVQAVDQGDDDGAGGAAGPGTSTGAGGGLAVTGTTVAGLAALAVLLLTAGLGAVGLRRRQLQG